MPTSAKGPLPDSYRRLTAYASRLASGARLYEQGVVPDRFYVVLRGEVRFEVVSEQGDPEVVARAQPGALVGHVAAFTRRPTSAAARVEGDTVVLAIPVARLTDAIREAPELGVRLIETFAAASAANASTPVAPVIMEASEYAVADDGAGGAPEAPLSSPTSSTSPVEARRRATGRDDEVIPVPGEVDTNLFFTDTVTCPISRTTFEYLRVRTRAVRPTERESDFHVRYEDVNPTWYGVVVCPACAYAAYLDDFARIDDASRLRLTEGRADRVALMSRPLNGARTLEDAITAMDLAIVCYEQRAAAVGRRAVLQHRRAWLEREAGNAEAERMWLHRARESFQQAYQEDTGISEEAAARIAYLVGDIAFRFDDLKGAAQWLETATRIAPKDAAGIARTARDRLQDVRELIKRERKAS